MRVGNLVLVKAIVIARVIARILHDQIWSVKDWYRHSPFVSYLLSMLNQEYAH